MNKITLVDAKFHALDIRFDFKGTNWKDKINLLWGQDIFINDIPVVKAMVLMNVITWIILFFVR